MKYINLNGLGLREIILDNSQQGACLIDKFIRKIYIEFKKDYNGYSNKNKHYQIILALYLLTTSIKWKINVRQQDTHIIQAMSILIIYIKILKRIN